MRAKPLTSSDGQQAGYLIQCPACDCQHYIAVEQPISNPQRTRNARWSFNGDRDRPTFTPSLLVQWPDLDGGARVCHSFIRDGRIQFLSDCTHDLAGQTVDLPDWED